MAMDLARVIEFCLSLPHAEETLPFGPEVLVYKAGGKAFALTNPDAFPSRVNLKCDPVRAEELRGEYDGIVLGYHMNKRHWNTVMLDGSVPSELVGELIRHSYDLVIKGLSRSVRRDLGL